MRHASSITLVLACLLGAACGRFFAGPSDGRARAAKAPSALYAEALGELGLDTSSLGQAWFTARHQALTNSATVALPLIEDLFFDPSRPQAHAYRLRLEKGRRFRAVAPRDAGEGRLFFELLRASSSKVSERWQTVAASDVAFEWEVRSTGDYVFLVQPELLTSGHFELSLSAPGALAFPVSGHSVDNIKSFWGARRDGGLRKHEGVDIFAKRGTPVVAATDGRVTHVHTGGLGGRVVWMKRLPRGPYLYYAHLDEQLVRPGTKVEVGDVLGTVGNTGNARTTPPHLHFGVYARRAMDPLPWVDVETPPAPPGVPAALLGGWLRIKVPLANLRTGPGMEHDAVLRLARHAALRSQGARLDWLKVETSSGELAWIHRQLVEGADAPLARSTTKSSLHLQLEANSGSPAIAHIAPESRLEILAKAPVARLVRTELGQVGWVTTVGAQL